MLKEKKNQSLYIHFNTFIFINTSNHVTHTHIYKHTRINTHTYSVHGISSASVIHFLSLFATSIPTAHPYPTFCPPINLVPHPHPHISWGQDGGNLADFILVQQHVWNAVLYWELATSLRTHQFTLHHLHLGQNSMN